MHSGESCMFWYYAELSFNPGFLGLEGPTWSGLCTSPDTLFLIIWAPAPWASFLVLEHGMAILVLGVFVPQSCLWSECSSFRSSRVWNFLVLPLSNQWTVSYSLSELSEYSLLLFFESSYHLISYLLLCHPTDVLEVLIIVLNYLFTA